MRGIRRCRLQRQADRLGNFVVADLPRRTATRLVMQPVKPVRGEALAPFADGLLVSPDLLRNRFVLLARRCGQHDPCPTRQALRGAPAARQTLQFAALRFCQLDGNRPLAYGIASQSGDL